MKAIKNTKTTAKWRREEQKKLREANQVMTLTPSRNDLADLIHIKRMKAHKDDERSRMFFFVGLNIALGLIYIIFNWNFRDDGAIISLGSEDLMAFEEIQDIPQTIQPPPPPPQMLQPPKIIEVSDDIIIEEVEIDIDVESTESMVVEDVEYDLPAIEEEVAEEIFYTSEKSPEPVGGIKAFYTFVKDNLKYPREARMNRIKGRVFIQFVVDKDGTLTNFKVLKGIGHGCDEEALRVLAMAPKWNPGKQRGVPVKVYMTMPIFFELR